MTSKTTLKKIYISIINDFLILNTDTESMEILNRYRRTFVFVSDPAAENLFQLPYSLSTDKIRDIFSYKICWIWHLAYGNQCGAKWWGQLPFQQPWSICRLCWSWYERNDPICQRLHATLDGTDQCAQHIQRLPEQEGLLNWFYNFGLYSWGWIPYWCAACPPPCTTLAAHSTFQLKRPGMFPWLWRLFLFPVIR